MLNEKAIAQSGTLISIWAVIKPKVRELATKIPSASNIAFSNDEELLKYIKSGTIQKDYRGGINRVLYLL